MSRKDRKARSPESERYDELKGKEVVLVLEDSIEGLGTIVRGKLDWVAQYTIGVFIRTGMPGRADQVWILNKKHIMAHGEA